jgi:hypothetical protein
VRPSSCPWSRLISARCRRQASSSSRSAVTIRHGVLIWFGCLRRSPIGRPCDGRSSGHSSRPFLAGRSQLAPGLRSRVCVSRKNARWRGSECSSRRMLIGYARVPTSGQDLAAQRDGLATLGVDDQHVHVDHGLSGTTRARPGPARRWLRAVPATSWSSRSSTAWPGHCGTRPTSRTS